ncbi:aquaporin-11-like [Amphiura filiformis]|uniref:aquaporin-11-like n=1 Tax=Amphiura filiformis TaxID=82378 RepID=UPI003B21FAC4
MAMATEWKLFTPASLLFTFLLVQLMRVTTRRLLPSSIYQFVGEFLCSFQLVTCVYENGLHLKQYGTAIYAIGLFTLSYGYSLTFDALGNPAAVFERFVKRKITFANGVLRIIFQVVGGLCAYKYIITIWTRMAPTGAHVQRLQQVFAGACVSHLQVDMMTGMICEACAMFVCRSIAGAGIGGKHYYNTVNAMTTVVVVLTGLNWTGMNINPALATATTYNCKGHTLIEHVVVYWIGPFLGVLASIALFHYVLKDEYTAGEKVVKEIDETGDHVFLRNGVTSNGIHHHPVENGVKPERNGVKGGKKGAKAKKTPKGKKGKYKLRRRSGGRVNSG